MTVAMWTIVLSTTIPSLIAGTALVMSSINKALTADLQTRVIRLEAELSECRSNLNTEKDDNLRLMRKLLLDGAKS